MTSLVSIIRREVRPPEADANFPDQGKGCRSRGNPLLADVLVDDGLQPMQIIGGTLGMGGGGEDRPFVVLQDLQPALNIGGMVFARLGGQGEVSTEERRAQLGDQFLAGIAFVAPAVPAKVTGKAGLMLRPVGEFMRQGRIIGLGARLQTH